MKNWSTYRPISPVLRELGLSCLGAGEQSGHLPSFKNRRLSSYGLVFISHGTGWFHHSGTTEKVTAPALIWLYPGLEHGYGSYAQGWTEHWALFSGVGVRAFEELGCLSRERPLVHLASADVALISIFRLLHDSLRAEGPLGDLQASIHTQQLIVSAGRSSIASSTANKSEELLGSLGEIAYESLTLGQQAAQLRLSESQLRRSVQKAAGVGPKEFVLQMRISRSQSLLAESNYPIERIARLVGYQDAAYFSRLFSQRTGTSPSQFRAQHFRAGHPLNSAFLP
ncbi:helix-turn-helix domain-containing protein [Arthrobacter sp. TMN-49]